MLDKGVIGSEGLGLLGLRLEGELAGVFLLSLGISEPWGGQSLPRSVRLPESVKTSEITRKLKK